MLSWASTVFLLEFANMEDQTTNNHKKTSQGASVSKACWLVDLCREEFPRNEMARNPAEGRGWRSSGNLHRLWKLGTGLPANSSGRISAKFPVGYQEPEEAQSAKNGGLNSRIEIGQSPVGLNKISRDFDVIWPVSGSVPDCFLSGVQNSIWSGIT